MEDQPRTARFPFRVRFANGAHAQFEECAGNDPDGGTTDYRHGNSPVFYPIKMPGLGRVGNIALRKGTFVNDEAFRDLSKRLEARSNERHKVVIDLINGENAVTTTWTLNNAWPTKIVTVDSAMNEVVVEELDIAFEEMIVAAP